MSLERRVYRVSELAFELAALLEDRVGRVWVSGEVSNLRRAASGHSYFTLKDETAQLRAVLFRGDARALPFELEDGLEAIAFAEVGLWAARGELQLIVRHLEPRGRGALQLAFEQLRRRLEAEGLFDAERKRPLPPLPRRLGIVTSSHGAAIRDVIEVTGARFPGLPLLIAPARVQGAGAEEELADALARLARAPGIDVILLVRGGGSLEDLLAFNTERLARAIVTCPVPVVTGVGHEVDVTIADLAADARAATPSAAAALAVPDRLVWLDRLARDRARLAGAVRSTLAAVRSRLEARRQALRHLSPLARLAARRTRLDTARRRLASAIGLALERRRGRLASRAGQLDSLSPLGVLGRGYAIVHRVRDGAIVRDPNEVQARERLRLRVARGEIDAQVLARRRPGGSLSD